MSYQRKDHFYFRAKREGYAARSVFKLQEMDKQYEIFRPNLTILDLGCAPGGWLQYAQEHTSGRGRLIGIDLLPLHITLGPHAQFVQGDFTDPRVREGLKTLCPNGTHWILSDMSPNLTGIRFKDLAASETLVESVINFTIEILRPGGGLISKVFPGTNIGALKQRLKKIFGRLSENIPEATRKSSTEVYLIATGFQRPTPKGATP